MIVPTPMVIARRGTFSSPPKAGALCLRVVGVRALTRVRERRAERGSLNPICQAEHQVWVSAQIMGDDPGDQGCCSFVVFLYNYFHRGEIRLSPASLEGKKDRREVHAPIWLTRLVGHGIKAWSAGLRPGESAKFKRAGSETGAPIDQNMMPRTKREHLRQLVEGKNQWSRPLTVEEKALGFLGWHERGYLPHCDFPGLIQFVTFRLADSMPSSRRAEWEHLLSIQDEREKRTKLEDYLDRGLGVGQLRKLRIGELAVR